MHPELGAKNISAYQTGTASETLETTDPQVRHDKPSDLLRFSISLWFCRTYFFWSSCKYVSSNLSIVSSEIYHQQIRPAHTVYSFYFHLAFCVSISLTNFSFSYLLLFLCSLLPLFITPFYSPLFTSLFLSLFF